VVYPLGVDVIGSQEVPKTVMDMTARKTVVKKAATRPRRARKKDKGPLLDEFGASNSEEAVLRP
jgi:hypothetical protein